MGENPVGLIMKSVASCLKTGEKITKHSIGMTVVQKVKRCGQLRDEIKEVADHASLESLKDYNKLHEKQQKNLLHMISGYRNPNSNTSVVEQFRRLTACNPTHAVNLSSLNVDNTVFCVYISELC